MKYLSILKKNPYLSKSIKFDQKLLKVDLNECGELLVDLRSLFSKSNVPVIFGTKSKRKFFYSRKTVAKAILKAAHTFSDEGYILKIEDAYRTVEEQRGKFTRRVGEINKKYKPASKKILYKMANMYTAGIPILAAHMAGAALDVTLVDKKNLKPIDFGTDYLSSSPRSATAYEKFPKKIIKYRNLLRKIMIASGFTNYPFEYWHYSIGDVCATFISKKKFAIYGPVNYNFETKKTVFVPKNQCYEFFIIE